MNVKTYEISFCSRNRDTFFNKPTSKNYPLAKPLTFIDSADVSIIHRTSSDQRPEEAGARAGGGNIQCVTRGQAHWNVPETGSAPW